jgi:Domain of unknown function (DUF4440)
MTLLRLIVLGWLALAVAPVQAHPPSTLNDAGQKATTEEIVAFRRQVTDAIKAKDAAQLRELYAPSFVHTHTSGKVDPRDARIVSALAGDPVIETAEVTELDIRVPNDWTGIATGLSPITSRVDGKIYAVRWMAVYVRTERSWVLAASQATRSHEIKN